MKKIFGWFFVFAFVTTAHAADNKELRIGIAQEFESLNPVIHQMVASGYIGDMVTHHLDAANAKWEWECHLCVEIPTLENGKAKLIEEGGVKKILVEWEIKSNAKWADGTLITAKDVILGWQVGSSPNVAVGEKEIYTDIEAITPDPANPQKFTMKYSKVKYDFNRLGTFYILPDHVEKAVWEKTKNTPGEYEKQTKYTTEPTNLGLYSGPYKIVELQLGSHVIVEPNPHFYGEPAKIKKIIFKLIPDTATLEANLLSGTIDVISELGLKLDQALAIEKRIARDPVLSQKFKVLYREGTTYEHIDLNLKNPLLQDVRVRQALVYAIDRDKLTQALFEGKQKKALHDRSPLDAYFTEDVVQYTYDPTKAAALLDEAGFKKGQDGYRYKDGQKLSFPLMTTAQDKTRELVQVFLQNEWKKAGIDITIKNEPARVYFGETVQKAKFPAMAMYAFVSTPDDPPRSTMHSSQIPTEDNAYNGQNRTSWSNPVADKNLENLYVEFDASKRKEMMKAVLTEYTREVPVIPLYFRVDIAVVPTNLKGFELTGHQFYSTKHANDWSF